MFRAIEHYFRRAFYALLNGPRAVLRALTAPFRWIGGIFAQIGAWWSRREGRYLLRGMPALLVFGGAGFLLVACRMRSDAVLADRYQSAAGAASNQPKVAALLLERVMQLRPRDNETLFELARMTQQAGDDARTAVLMRELAPDPGPNVPAGYAPAHMEMGKAYLKNQHLSHANFVKARQHFEEVLDKNPNNAEAHAYLGQLYFAGGLSNDAIPHFERAIEINDQQNEAGRADLQVLTLLLAKCYSKTGDYDKAESLAETAREHFAKRLKEHQSTDVESRIILADTCMFLEDFPGASSVLKDGLMLDNDAEHQKVLHAAVARLNVAWAEYVKEQDDSSEKNRQFRFDLLNEALKYDPYHDPIFDKMMELLGEKTETAATGRDYLLENLSEGRAIGMSHLLLGSIAFEKSDPAAAEYHLERAFHEMPNALVVMNNLAWFLAFKKNPPELDRALGLIDNVLERAPNDPRYLDTRGQIYTRLERWDDAIADLERALQKGLSTPETHNALATCYGAKGVRDLERRHEDKARPDREKNR